MRTLRHQGEKSILPANSTSMRLGISNLLVSVYNRNVSDDYLFGHHPSLHSMKNAQYYYRCKCTYKAKPSWWRCKVHLADHDLFAGFHPGRVLPIRQLIEIVEVKGSLRVANHHQIECLESPWDELKTCQMRQGQLVRYVDSPNSLGLQPQQVQEVLIYRRHPLVELEKSPTHQQKD